MYVIQHKSIREEVFERQGLQQDGLNYLSYNSLKIPIIIADVYGIF